MHRLRRKFVLASASFLLSNTRWMTVPSGEKRDILWKELNISEFTNVQNLHNPARIPEAELLKNPSTSSSVQHTKRMLSKNDDIFDLHRKFLIPQREEFEAALESLDNPTYMKARIRQPYRWLLFPCGPLTSVAEGVTIETGTQFDRQVCLRDGSDSTSSLMSCRMFLMMKPSEKCGTHLRSNYIRALVTLKQILVNSPNFTLYSFFGILDGHSSFRSFAEFRDAAEFLTVNAEAFKEAFESDPTAKKQLEEVIELCNYMLGDVFHTSQNERRRKINAFRNRTGIESGHDYGEQQWSNPGISSFSRAPSSTMDKLMEFQHQHSFAR